MKQPIFTPGKGITSIFWMNCLMQITSDRAVIHHAQNPFTLPKAVWNRRKSFWPGMGSMTGSVAENKGSTFLLWICQKPGGVWTATGSVFPTICVLPLQNTDVWKFPYGNFLPLKASKPQQKTAPKGGSLTVFDCAWYDADGRCYFWRSDPLFLSRSLRQEEGGACTEKGFSAFLCVQSSCCTFSV